MSHNRYRKKIANYFRKLPHNNPSQEWRHYAASAAKRCNGDEGRREFANRGCIEGASSVQAQRSSVKDATVLLIGTLCQAARGPRSISSTTVHRPPPASARTVTKMRGRQAPLPARWRPSSRATVLDGGRSYTRPKKPSTRVSFNKSPPFVVLLIPNS